MRPTSLTICSGGRSVFWPASISHSPGVVLYNARIQLRKKMHIPQTTDHRPQTTDHRPQTTDHRPQTTDHRPQKPLVLNIRGRTRGDIFCWHIATNVRMAIEQHNKTGTIIENRQMSRLQGRVRGAYIITEMLISVCPSTQLYHITYWGCMTYWGCKPYWGSRTYTSFQSDIMHCAKVCEKRIVPISQKVLELCHALISQSRDPESLLKIMKAIELLSHSDHLLLR